MSYHIKTGKWLFRAMSEWTVVVIRAPQAPRILATLLILTTRVSSKSFIFRKPKV